MITGKSSVPGVIGNQTHAFLLTPSNVARNQTVRIATYNILADVERQHRTAAGTDRTSLRRHGKPRRRAGGNWPEAVGGKP